ncbi:MAG TPA: ATP-binding protein [Actinomycetota bacterium]|nr:ATP-binding protein [Actinomycetota bacterium]
MKRSFSADAASLHEVRRFVRERAGEAALYRRDAEDLILAVSEICANAVQHAESENFVVSWRGGPSGMTEVKVRDEGVFAAKGVGHKSGPRGYGLPLVAALVDEVSISRGTPANPGTTVRLIKHRD